MVTSVPTSLVTFLFTDVEGSTRLWEADPDGMKLSLEEHDRILRHAIGEHHGHVFSTAGDAFAAAFHAPEDAVAAALEAQRALAASPWPGPAVAVRMGIHSGTAAERDGDYFGPTLNRAARIMSAGHGGQILVSSVTAGRGSFDGSAQLHDLGTHHLKDLAEPEHVFEVRHPALAVVDRPIRMVDIRRHNLPDYLTSFVGRTDQLRQLADLIAGLRGRALELLGENRMERLLEQGAELDLDAALDLGQAMLTQVQASP